MLRSVLAFWGLIYLSFGLNAVAQASATTPKREMVWSTADQRWLSVAEFQARFQNGDVLVLGEEHAFKTTPSTEVHHANQLRLLQNLGLNHQVSLGMEFFAYPDQGEVDRLLAGQFASQKSERKFLKRVSWGRAVWPLYRPQVFEPLSTGGVTLALNMPRSVTGKVSQNGPKALTKKDRRLLPPIWEKGQPLYFERFSEAMAGHATPKQMENYFWSQSLWEDTMAWRTSLHRQRSAEDVFVIIVGQFHVEYGLGLATRLKRYGVNQVKTLVQAEIKDWNEANLTAATASDPHYGPRADYIWTYQLP